MVLDGHASSSAVVEAVEAAEAVEVHRLEETSLFLLILQRTQIITDRAAPTRTLPKHKLLRQVRPRQARARRVLPALPLLQDQCPFYILLVSAMILAM
jgi:hypothetical protein